MNYPMHLSFALQKQAGLPMKFARAMRSIMYMFAQFTIVLTLQKPVLACQTRVQTIGL